MNKLCICVCVLVIIESNWLLKWSALSCTVSIHTLTNERKHITLFFLGHFRCSLHVHVSLLLLFTFLIVRKLNTLVSFAISALPRPPTSLIVTETTATSVTLTWDSGNPEPISYYVIQYRAKVSDNGFQEVDGVASTRYSIGGLSPYSEYEFRVMAVNNIGRGPPSGTVETRTSEQAPSSPPLRVQARMLSATTMLVQWEPPEEPNGQIRGYRVYYTSDMHFPLSAWQKHNTEDSSLTTISGLVPDITYGLRVLAFTSVGDGPPSDILQVKTQQGGEIWAHVLIVQ